MSSFGKVIGKVRDIPFDSHCRPIGYIEDKTVVFESRIAEDSLKVFLKDSQTKTLFHYLHLSVYATNATYGLAH